MTIQDKLTLLISLFGVILVLILSIFFYMEMKQILEDHNQSRLEMIVDSRLMSIRHVLNLRSEQTRHIADTWMPRQLSREGNNSEELIGRIQNHIESIVLGSRSFDRSVEEPELISVIDRISVTDPDGLVLASSDRSLIGTNRPEWMLRGVRDRNLWFGGIQHDTTTVRDYLLFIEPVHHIDSGEFVGMVSVRIGMEVFGQVTLNRSGLGETGEIFLVERGADDSFVRFITPLRFASQMNGRAGDAPEQRHLELSPGHEEETGDLLMWERGDPAFSLIERESGAGIVRDYRGEEVSAVWRWIPDLQLGIVGKIDTSELYAPVYRLRNIVIVAGVGVLLLSLIIAWYLARSFSRPVEHLAEVFSGISRGENVAPVDIVRTDEIGILGESANRSISYLNRVKAHAGRIADGNTDSSIHLYGEKDELGKALQKMTESLRSYRRRIVFLLRETRRQNQRLQEHREQIIRDMAAQRELERRVIQISDEERRRIGRDIHDGLGQMLTGIRMVSENLARRLMANEIPGASEVREIADMVQEADEFTRSLSRGMLQVDIEECCIPAALENLCRNSEKLLGVECRYRETGSVLIENHSVALAIYRIVQESITNAVRHGDCNRIEVSLARYAHTVRLHVDDDGKGLSEDWEHGSGKGIEIMKYRASIFGGSVEVFRTPEQWTRVRCLLPVGGDGKTGTSASETGDGSSMASDQGTGQIS